MDRVRRHQRRSYAPSWWVATPVEPPFSRRPFSRRAAAAQPPRSRRAAAALMVARVGSSLRPRRVGGGSWADWWSRAGVGRAERNGGAAAEGGGGGRRQAGGSEDGGLRRRGGGSGGRRWQRVRRASPQRPAAGLAGQALSDQKVTAIGIAPWGAVLEKERLHSSTSAMTPPISRQASTLRPHTVPRTGSSASLARARTPSAWLKAEEEAYSAHQVGRPPC